MTGTGTADAIVRFEAVTKSYDGRIAVVEDLDLAIRRGEFLTLLGPSGSGKTTTLMMLAGFETVTRGCIFFDGAAIDHMPPHRRNIGVVFQSYALFPHMSVADNVAFPLRMRRQGRAAVEARVRQVLDMVKMTGFEERLPNQLSGGQQQRVALARALAFEPPLILMDEPLGALDKQLREHMQLEIRNLHRSLGVTIVYVTHDQDEALTMSDRVAVFRSGRIEQLASPQQLYYRPASRFVAEFIGENNLLPGTLGRDKDAEGAQSVLLADGSRLLAPAARGLAPGAPVLLSVRPERIRLSPGAACTNRVCGRLEEVIFHGDHVRVRVAAAGASMSMKTTLPPSDLPLAVGSEVTVGWGVDDCQVLTP